MSSEQVNLSKQWYKSLSVVIDTSNSFEPVLVNRHDLTEDLILMR